ncbi:MAG: hypothetical protein SOZ52_07885 [Pyramidobacter sp.]|nr:hypothetical protein [Pyramidobacter sp.]
MRKFRMLLALCVALSLSCASAFAAPSAADLASGGFAAKDWAAFGVRDVKAIADSKNPVIAKMIKDQLSAASVPAETALHSLDVRVELKVTEDGGVLPGAIALAGELLRPLTEAEIATMSLAKTDVAVNAPEGMKLNVLGTIETEEVGKLIIAVLERDGKQYLVGATTAEVLGAVAAAPEGNKEVRDYTSSNIWIQGSVSAEVMEAMGAPAALPFIAELGIQDTEKSVCLRLWTNVVDHMSAAAGKDLRAAMTGGFATKKPLLMGNGPLMALFNMAMSYVPEQLKVEDVVADEASRAMVSGTVEGLSELGASWADVINILRNNVTIGVAGNLTTPFGKFPGLYLHVGGVSEALGKMLVQMAAASGEEMLGAAPAPFTNGTWSGVQVASPVALFIASGAEGFIAGAMDMDQFGTVPTVVPEISAVAEAPTCLSLAVNVKDLLPVLRNLNETVVPMMEDDEVTFMSMMALGVLEYFNAATVEMKTADMLSVELFLNAENMAKLLAGEEAEEAPAAEPAPAPAPEAPAAEPAPAPAPAA